jgi:hypothetical protein
MAAALSRWVCMWVWKYLWWWCDWQVQMHDIHVSIEVIDVNARITCLFLGKSRRQRSGCRKMENPLIITMEFGSDIRPLRAWYHIWSMIWLRLSRPGDLSVTYPGCFRGNRRREPDH